ncbi:tyrosine phosphatase family protein [Acetobacter syzygii]|uniref:tyrosine phosphatase family protein n=1 Tax=Acetobacter syzygii TaxID=146476 RepID=UPI0020C5C235|nr:tyrosine protein phosphatase [Acetobacter syzygii]
MTMITVTNLSRARRIKRRGFDAVLTLEDPACSGNQLRFHVKPAPDHLVMHFEDIDDDEYDYAIAMEDDVKVIIEFGRKHVQHNLLIHCFHGIGRSGGAALAILTDRLGNAQSALEALLAIRPEAVPNLRIARLADTVLRTDGAMVAVLDAWAARTPSVAEFRRQKRAFFEANRDLYSRATALM